MRRIIPFLSVAFLLLLFPFWGFVAHAQQPLRFGSHTVTPPANVQVRTRGAGGVVVAKDNPYMVVQFAEPVGMAQRHALARLGVELLDYVGGEAYFAKVPAGFRPGALRSSGAVSMLPIAPEWKVDPLVGHRPTPPWAVADDGALRLVVSYWPELAQEEVAVALRGVGARALRFSGLSRRVELELAEGAVASLVALPCVELVSLVGPKLQLQNLPGETLAHDNLLAQAGVLGGRGLTGRGVKIGVWDGNVQPHPDMDSRAHVQEFEFKSEHGMHVTGTVGGSGLIDPLAKGMAPQADFYTYNFNVQSNGKRTYEEMEEARRRFGITLTQNSYGYNLRGLCSVYKFLSYNFSQSDVGVDELSRKFPTLLHVFAAGNDQGSCRAVVEQEYGKKGYGTSSNRLKNAVTVGAVWDDGHMTGFSSWGPLDDGRLVPIVSAVGRDVYSTVYGNDYGVMSGTSMACPTASGSLALVTQRYQQLHGFNAPRADLLKALAANTAEDAGRKGVDYVYGYGLLNAENMVEALERGWYGFGEFEEGADQKVEFPIPAEAGASGLRVMVVWMDATSDKNYAWGEPALVNDIDLYVKPKAGAKTMLPLVLDPKHPEELAKPGVDRLNNIEQVCVERPEGDYVAVVNPTAIRQGKQPFALVWWYELPKLRVTYPNGGEQLVASSEDDLQLVRVRWEDATGPVDISLELGENEQISLAKGVEGGSCEVEMPAGKWGRGRIVVTDGRASDESDADFTLLGVPELGYTGEGALPGMRLEWTKALGATGYELLRADVERGEYKSLKSLPASDTSYTLGAGDIIAGQNIFTVRALGADGLVGQRAKAVVLEGLQPRVLSPKTLPIAEYFVSYPTSLFTVKTGRKVSYYYQPVHHADDPDVLGQNMLVVLMDQGKVAELLKKGTFKEFEMTSDYSKNPQNVATLQFAELDLTDIPKGQKVYFQLDYSMNFFGNYRASQFKVRVGGKLLESTYGTSIFHAISAEDDPFRSATFDISEYAGKKIAPKLQWLGGDIPPAGSMKTNVLVIKSIRFFQSKEGEVEIADLLDIPQGRVLGKSETITIGLRNTSDHTIRSVPVFYQVDGRAPVYEQIPELKPFEDMQYTFKQAADMSVEDELGALFHVKAGVAMPQGSGKPQEFKTKEADYINYGQTHPLKLSSYGSMFGLRMAVDPSEVITVKDRVILVDNGGAFGKYSEDQQTSSVRLLPWDNTKIIQLSFSSISMAEGDTLRLYLNQYPAPWAFNGVKGDYNLSGDAKAPPVFVSRAPDGSIVLSLNTTGREDPKAGFVAEARAIDRENIFSLTVPRPVAAGTEVPLSIEVENLSEHDRHKVEVGYREKGGKWQREVIDVVAKGKKVPHIFKEKLEVPALESRELEFAIFSWDAEPKDNTKELLFTNDRYRNLMGIEKPEKAFILDMSYNGISLPVGDAASTISYHLDAALEQYAEESAVLEMDFNRALRTKDYQGAVYVDWNADGDFEDSGEEYPITLGGRSARVEIEPPSTVATGETRMRVIILSKEAGALQSYEEEKLVPAGDAEDYKLKVQAGANSKNSDIAVYRIVAESGLDMDSPQTIGVWVSNLLDKPTSAGVVLTCTLDEGKPSEKTFEQEFKAMDKKGLKLFTFDEKADFSAVGKHTIKVVAAVKGGVVDDDPSNNTLTKSVYNVKPEPNGFYALHIPKGKRVNLGNIDLRSLQDSATIGFWLKIAPNAKKVVIFDGKGIKLWYDNDPDSRYPERSLVLEYDTPIGVKRHKHSFENALEPGLWHHVYITHRGVGYLIGPNVYCTVDDHYPFMQTDLDDTPAIPIDQNRIASTPKQDMYLGGEDELWIDEFRIWEHHNITGKKNRIPYIYDHAPDNAKFLLRQFSFDEGGQNVATTSRYIDPANPLLTATQVVALPEGVHFVRPDEDGMFASIRFADQVGETERLGFDKYQVEFDADSELNPIYSRIVTMWPNADFFINGKLKEDTVFNFRDAPRHTIGLSAQTQIFDHSIAGSVSIVAKQGKSRRCDLTSLSLRKDENPGLTKDVKFDNPPLDIRVEQTGLVNPNAVTLRFKLSEGATLSDGTKELKDGDQVDLSAPLTLTVTAEDGKTTKAYRLFMATAQEITGFSLTKTMTYGEEQELKATSTQGLAVQYTVSDNSVVAVVRRNGKQLLKTVGAGKAEVYASQPGEGAILPAEQQTLEVEVKRKAITAEPRMEVEAYELDRIAQLLEKKDFTYDVVEGDAAPMVEQTPNYTLQKDGKSWGIDQMLKGDFLQAGTYTLATAPGQKLRTPRYEVTFEGGQLTVKEENTVMLTLKVMQGGKPVPQATILLNGMSFTTADNGQITIPVQKGKELKVKVMKEGLGALKEQTISKASLASDFEQTFTFGESFTLTYAAGANGELLGALEQHIPQGGDASPIEAIPAAGYVFEQWDDNSKDNPRQDLAVDASKTITAQFKAIVIELQYVAGAGGRIEGPSRQTLAFGKDGEAVQAVPDDGYEFVDWSDGSTSDIRSEEELVRSETLTANFRFKRANFALPYVQNFDDQEGMPQGWSSEDLRTDRKIPRRHSWQVSTRDVFHQTVGIGQKVYFISAAAHDSVYLVLKTPELDIEGIGADVQLKYKLAYGVQHNKAMLKAHPSFFRLSYTTDGGASWTQLKDYKHDVDDKLDADDGFKHEPRKQDFTIARAKLAGKSTLQFKWEYCVKDGLFAAMDDFEVLCPATSRSKMTYLAGEGGHLRVNGQDKAFYEHTANPGEVAPAVEAVPDANHHFLRWSDSLKDSPKGQFIARRPGDSKSVYVKALFAKGDDPAGSLYTLTYSAGEHGTINGLEVQQIAKGKDAYSVTALPEEGWEFEKWDDNSKDNPRQDKNVQGDLNATASFKQKSYTVKFDLQYEGAPAIAGQTKMSGEKADEPTDPERTGYKFGGWFTYKTCEDEDRYYFTEKLMGNITLYAKWSKEWNVEYEVVGMTAPVPVAAKVADGELLTPPVLSKEGAKVASPWYLDNGYTYLYDAQQPVVSDLTLYAKYTDPVELTFSKGSVPGATGMPGKQTLASGVLPDEPATEPTAGNGYIFKGWFTQDTGGEPFDFSLPLTSSKTVFAQWTALHRVSFYLDGNPYTVDGSPLEQLVEEGSPATRPANPIEKGKLFDGWYREQTCQTVYDFGETVTQATKLYGQYKALLRVDFKVRHSDPSIPEEVLPAAYVEQGAKLVRPADPILLGYRFNGWFKDETCKKPFDFSNPISGPTTIYTKFTRATTFKFIANSDNKLRNVVKDYGTEITKDMFPTPEREGHRFTGWFNEPEYKTPFKWNTYNQREKLVYGRMELQKFYITLYYNYSVDGEEQLEMVQYEWGTSLKPIHANPQREGAEFQGWFLDKALTKPYDSEEPIEGALTLYAKWNLSTYSVVFHTADGGILAERTVEHGATLVDIPQAPAAPAGKEFKGWRIGSAMGTKFDPSAPVVAELDLYPVYATKKPTPSEPGNGDVDPKEGTPVSQAFAGQISLAPNPARDLLYLRNLKAPGTVYIYSLLGEMVRSQRVAPQSAIALKGLRNGVYLLRIGDQCLRFTIAR